MRSDSEIKADVEDELRWDRAIDASDIAVAVHDGVVALTGYVRSYMQRTRAERDAKRIAGTLGVANDIEVRLPFINKRPDPEIARNAVEKLHDALPDSSEFIKLTVKAGWLTLEGDVEWDYQRNRAAEAVQAVRGVVGVSDNLKVKPRVASSDVKRQIEAALKRSAELDAQRISVETSDSKVTLKGSVSSWAERREAERAAWQAPGITTVENQIAISP
ncbi:MAG TPA: BON domain-containing protein [Candidatus Sulfotelmatobacter sp.]|jgi:osmotically-inducible protein OsmY|nr:BON domain-containing protein [Candidatus Sulfotelmatobacter sp.]